MYAHKIDSMRAERLFLVSFACLSSASRSSFDKVTDALTFIVLMYYHHVRKACRSTHWTGSTGRRVLAAVGSALVLPAPKIRHHGGIDLGASDMSESDYSTEFSDVDRAKDPQWYVKCLAAQGADDHIDQFKRHTVDLLSVQPGEIVLDAGCGLGQYTVYAASALQGEGCAVGIDSSDTMIGESEKYTSDATTHLRFLQDDIHHLHFEDNYFDACFSINTFQHLPDPSQALRELIRVTKPGGRIAVADPDHELVAIDTPYLEVNRKFLHFRSDSLKQGGLAHRLYGLFKQYGLMDVDVEVWPLVFTDYEQRKLTSPYLDEIWIAQEHEAVSKEEAEAWSAYLRQTVVEERFLSIQTSIITVGRKRS
jgi:ubiquinone/menaquinone biosynthesis C-methylase UbiE